MASRALLPRGDRKASVLRPTDHAPQSHGGARPRWSEVLRALRDARGGTQEGWAARIGVSRKSVQRWENGERAPDPGAERSIIAYCREAGLLRSFDRGPLAGLTLTAERLQELFAEARWRVDGRPSAASGGDPTAARPRRAAPPDGPDRARTGTAPSNLPAPLTSFVGRERELAAVRRLQAGTRLLTLAGPGGCGKTRLALELARELLWAYPHGVRLVELAAIADAAVLPQTVAAAFGLQTVGLRPPLEAIKEFLRARYLLLILDNCEHLLPACAHLAEALLRDCPTFSVVATSREPLGIAGEAVWRVPPMAVPGMAPHLAAPEPSRPGPAAPHQELEQPDSVRLFVERARLQRPDFELTPANAPAVAEVCRRLDGLPLAIELAAARVRMLSVEQIAARLGDRLGLLTGAGRTALPRHQTLRAALDWSHDLLTAPERALLRRLAVFAGGFTLEAAEEVCEPANEGTGAPTDILDLLAQLVDKSLVIAEEHEGAMRYHMLETVRQYAYGKLDEVGEAATVRERHLDWCLSLVQAGEAAYRGPDEPAWLDRLEQEDDNIRAALGWSVRRAPAAALRLAGSLARFWEMRSHVHEGRRWLALALAAGEGAPAGARATALDGEGLLAELQGDYAVARDRYERSLLVHHQLGDDQRLAWTQGSLGRCAFRQGEYDRARALFEASLALHQRLGHRPGIASVQGALGLLALRQGDLAAAGVLIESRLAISRELGNKDSIADALDDLASLALEQGEDERYAALLEESRDLARELGNRSGIALALAGLGMAAWVRRENDRASVLLRESLTIYREVGDPRGIARVLGGQSIVALYAGDDARAQALSRDCLGLYREVGDLWAIGRYLPVLAAATFRLGRPEPATSLFGAAAALRARLGTHLPRLVRPEYDRTIAALRETLGEPAFTSAWAAGQTMPLEEATGMALT
jgi:predicted ATPase/transcriptional regulator with XRE-family HTH domain